MMHLVQNTAPRDHGGNLDRAMAQFGGTRDQWLDLSTGINPAPYPVPPIPDTDWSALPDEQAQAGLVAAARDFWSVPAGAAVLAAPGASALIASIPYLQPPAQVRITAPTYNEHAAAFRSAGWTVTGAVDAPARVMVHPNNPDGRLFTSSDAAAALSVIDESFCDVTPSQSLVPHAGRPGVVVLKSFGKFWGLAGLRLGFAIGAPDLIGRLTGMLGPWPVSGPALRIATLALSDHNWAGSTRDRLRGDRKRLDGLMVKAGASVAGGTDLFGLYSVDDAAAWQVRLARTHIWTRIFPYSDTLIRLGLPAPDRWSQLERAI